MKRKLMPSILLLFVLSLCSVKTFAETALQFNDRLVAITDSLSARGTAWGNKYGELSESKNYKELTPYRVGMQKFIDKKIAELKVTKGVGKGAPEFIKAMIEFLTFERQLTNSFVPFEKFNSSSSEDEMKKAMDDLTEATKKEDAMLKNVGAAQEAYAEKNDFAIAEPKGAEKNAE